MLWKVEEITYNETEKHIESLSFRMKKVGEEAFLEMPIGILLINEQYMIEWANPFMLQNAGCGYVNRSKIYLHYQMSLFTLTKSRRQT